MVTWILGGTRHVKRGKQTCCNWHRSYLNPGMVEGLLNAHPFSVGIKEKEQLNKHKTGWKFHAFLVWISQEYTRNQDKVHRNGGGNNWKHMQRTASRKETVARLSRKKDHEQLIQNTGKAFTFCPSPGAAWWNSWPARLCYWRTPRRSCSSWPRRSQEFPVWTRRGTVRLRSGCKSNTQQPHPHVWQPLQKLRVNSVKRSDDLQDIRDDPNAPVEKKKVTRLTQTSALQRQQSQRQLKALTTCLPPGPVAHSWLSPELKIDHTRRTSSHTPMPPSSAAATYLRIQGSRRYFWIQRQPRFCAPGRSLWVWCGAGGRFCPGAWCSQAGEGDGGNRSVTTPLLTPTAGVMSKGVLPVNAAKAAFCASIKGKWQELESERSPTC